jgi:uncharacterized protein (DUF4415 family)
MSKNEGPTIRLVLDSDHLPPLTAEERAQAARLAAMPDDKIDYSDIPDTPEDFWNDAERPGICRSGQEATTIRIDSDVLAWLKSEGRGYRTRINQILRAAYLEAHERPNPDSRQ